MPVCEVCGNTYDKTFVIEMDGYRHTFDSFECAIYSLAPNCLHCGCRILGHGMESNGVYFCCAHCMNTHLPPTQTQEETPMVNQNQQNQSESDRKKQQQSEEQLAQDRRRNRNEERMEAQGNRQSQQGQDYSSQSNRQRDLQQEEEVTHSATNREQEQR